jgi:hypothetical protein
MDKTEQQTEQTAETKTRRKRSANEVLQNARDRKQTELIKLEVRERQLAEELRAVTAKVQEGRAELARYDLALGGGQVATPYGPATAIDAVTGANVPRAAE